MIMFKCRDIWLIFVIGLFWTWNRCEGRSVNISNTWTLPQDGFAVFYRFFRDKISWFEADAVCQFHHANLVTVDNGQQFDAAREFLKVLGVTDSVWIGLMRPQNSERFTWSNSKPLASTSGYWAESLPLIESPLCAVIDPVRDFRWHALRCGGPETASFLCEMNVPNWAVDCTIQKVPDLTIQYMADSGTVELTRDCGDDEVLHKVCKGKQDRARIMKELVCKNERKDTIEDNSITSTDLADTHHKSLQIISNMPSDNNEDNNIHLQEQLQEEKREPEQNPVQKLIEQFNVEELMQADQPQVQEFIPKPVKKVPPKKVQINEKKDKSVKKQKSLKDKTRPTFSEELMMSDQPSANINQIQELLPHIKKSLPQDLKHPATTPQVVHTTTELLTTEVTEMTTQGVSEESSSVYISTSTENIETSPPTSTIVTTEIATEKISEHATSIETAQQTQTTEEPIHTAHPKEHSDNHFIPPMLLVKSHYTSSKPHPDDQSLTASNSKFETTNPNHDITSQTTFGTTTNSTTLTTSMAENFKVANTTFEPSQTSAQQHHQVVEIKIGDSDNPTVEFSVTTRPAIGTTMASLSHDTTTSPTTTIETIDKDNSHSSSTTQQGIATKNEFPSGNSESASSEHADTKQFKSKNKNKFSNEENFQPYRPNRRRSLTKPEATNYLKKMLG